jgi:hypothetical protein
MPQYCRSDRRSATELIYIKGLVEGQPLIALLGIIPMSTSPDTFDPLVVVPLGLMPANAENSRPCSTCMMSGQLLNATAST